MRVARIILRLLDEHEVGECREGVEEMGWDLKREWKGEGRLGQREVWGRGWAWVSGGEY